jgi:dipeptidyl aminopeptidase/acylaminoacyl peptidase
MPGTYDDYHWTAYQGLPEYADGTRWKTSPSEIPRNWEALDGRTQVARLCGKLFIQLSELDENVPPGQMLQFIDALIAADKDFEMLFLPGRAHQLLSEPYVIKRNWDFMIRHLIVQAPEPTSYRVQMHPEHE